MSEDTSSKSNGVSTDPLQRLASFKPPRDLSLGGVKPNKKLFTPNLNVSRNKNKGLNNTDDKDHKKGDKNRKDRKDKNRNKNFKNGPNVIKSSGVFSEGLGSVERHSSRISYTRDSEPSATTLQKPTIRVRDFVKIDKELEEQKIRSVFGESGVDDEEESVDFRKIKEKNAPIKLPIDDGGLYHKVKQEITVKLEPEDASADVTDGAPEKLVVNIKKDPCEGTEVVNLLKSDEPMLILLQLPDNLPGRGGSKDDDLPRRKHNDQPSTSTEEPEKDETDNRCRLSELEEGRIGKLRVHRSGRVSLLLGDTVFEVCMGTKSSFHQEVVSVACDDSSRSANLVSLGSLQHKLNLVPDWETLFQDITL